MSRSFWVVVGAVGGVFAYRKGTLAAQRAKELGPLGSVQVAAATTSRLAGRTAHGLGRLQEVKARREGRLLSGAPYEVGSEQPVEIPEGWVPASAPDAPPDAQLGTPPSVPATAPTTNGSR